MVGAAGWVRGVCVLAVLMEAVTCLHPSAFPHLHAAARAQARRTAASFDPPAYPSATHNDTPVGKLNSWTTSDAVGWTAGFFPGILWKIAAAEGMASEWVAQALRWTEGLREQQHDTHHHDVGFKVFGSFGQALELTAGTAAASELGARNYTSVVITAAHSLSTRFNQVVGCTQSWDAGHHCRTHPNELTMFPVIIDNMMNLELLFWAARNTSNATLQRMAESHANKTAEHHVRPDGSTFHVVDYNATTGRVIRRCTAQGFSDSSTWSRGQAWCIYGFTIAFRYTRQPLHLQTARRCADFVLAHTAVQGDPPDRVPLWDFDYPGTQGKDYRDASAGVIAASALIELSTFVNEALTAITYRDAAVRILSSLDAGYVGDFASTQGVLVHSTGANPLWSPKNFDVSLVYAGYYAIEAVARLNSSRAHLSSPPHAPVNVSASQTEISSIKQLVEALPGSGQHVRLAPGIYEIRASDFASGQFPAMQGWPGIFNFSGSGNTFDFSGAVLRFNTSAMDSWPARAHGDLVRLGGSHNRWLGLTWEDVRGNTTGGTFKHMSGGTVFSLRGSNNTLAGATLVTTGSEPYGFGALYGKTGSHLGTLPGVQLAKKACLQLINATEGTAVRDTTIDHSGFGHGVFLQGHTSDIEISDTRIIGQTRSTDEVLHRGVAGRDRRGVPFQVVFNHTAYAEDVPGAADARAFMQNAFRPGALDRCQSLDSGKQFGPILPGTTFALTEDGLRGYGDYATAGSNIIGAVTLWNVSVDGLRCGVCNEGAVSGMHIRGLHVQGIAGHGGHIRIRTRAAPALI